MAQKKPEKLSVIYNDHPISHESFEGSFGVRQLEMMPLRTLQRHPLGSTIRQFSCLPDSDTGARIHAIIGADIYTAQHDSATGKILMPAAHSAGQIARDLHDIYCERQLENYRPDLSPCGTYILNQLVKAGSRTWQNLADRNLRRDDDNFLERADNIFISNLTRDRVTWSRKLNDFKKESYPTANLSRDTALLTGPVLDLVTHLPGTRQSFLMKPDVTGVICRALEEVYREQPAPISFPQQKPSNVIALHPRGATSGSQPSSAPEHPI